jgi:hypothetical protein
MWASRSRFPEQPERLHHKTDELTDSFLPGLVPPCHGAPSESAFGGWRSSADGRG